MIILVSVICVLLLLYYLVAAKYSYWKTRGVLFDKPFLIFGNFYKMAIGQQDMSKRIREIYDKYKGPYVGIYIITEPYLMIKSPELIKQVLVKNFDKFINRTFYTTESIDPIAFHSLGASKDAMWRNLRNKITPAFSSGKMKLMFPLIKNCAQDLSNYLSARNEETVDVAEMFKKYTVDIISSCAFGIDAYCLKNNDSEIFKMAIQLQDTNSFIRNISLVSIFFISSFVKIFGLTFTDKFATKYFVNVFKSTLEKRAEMKIVRNDFIDLLNNLKKNETFGDNYTFDDVKMAAQSIVFFSAGNDTTTSTLSFIFYELAINNEIQDRLRREINQYLENDENLTYDTLQEIKYLDMVLNETLRKYPVASSFTRESVSNVTFEETGFTLEKDSTIMIPVAGLHYDPEYFPDPEKFDPERFNDENKQKIKPYTYLPFGEGPRSCVGERFAKLVSKVALVYAIKDFVFEVTDATAIPIQLDPYAVFMKSKSGVMLRIRKIH